MQTPTDPQALALAATLADDRRARRFLDLTGIGTDELRRSADDPALLAALIAFLEAHEPDLVNVSQEIGVEPAKLAAIRHELEGSR